MTNDTDVLSDLYKFATPVLIGIVGYFLKGILKTIRRIEQDFGKFREEYAGHRVVLQEHKERLEKIERKLEESDRDFKLFFMEYGSVLKNAKNNP